MSGKTVVVKDTAGALYDLPAENLSDALNSGYTQASDEDLRQESLQKEYGGFTGELTSAGLGALESASFGLSTPALTGAGILTPEEYSGYREANPTAYATGQVGGVVGSLLVPGANLVKGADIARKGITAATLKALPKATTRAGKIIEGVAAGAAGSAVEGAFYGAGMLVTDASLGDPDLNAEKIINTLGYSALMGGAIGGLLGPIEAKYLRQAEAEKFLPDNAPTKLVTPSGNTEIALGTAEIVDPKKKQGILQGFKQLKDNAKDIQKAADTLSEAVGYEVPVLEGAISASKDVQNFESILQQSPTTTGQARRVLADKGYDAVEQVAKEAVETEQKLTKVELGDALRDSLTNKLESQSKPITELYDYLKQSTSEIPVSPRAKNAIIRNIKALEDYKFKGSPARQVGDDAIAFLENINTVDDIKRATTQLRRKHMLGDKFSVATVAEKLRNLEENSILRAANFVMDETGDAGIKEQLKSLVNARKQANAEYKVFKKKMETLSKVLGRKRVKGFADFKDFIDDLTPEKISEKLFAKKNARFLETFKKEFPEEADLLFAFEKGKLLEQAMKNDAFNIGAFYRNFDKLEPEIKRLMFTADELKRLSAGRTFWNANKNLPRMSGPSGTPAGIEARAYWDDITGAINPKNIARDFMLEKMVERSVRGGLEESPELFVGKLAAVERTVNKTTNLIRKAAGKVFETTGKVVDAAPGAVILLSPEEKEKKFEKIKKDLETLDFPTVYMEKLESVTDPLYATAPNISASLQMGVSRASQFLKSKLPPAPPTASLERPITPSDAEISDFLNYYEAVENPLIVLEQAAQGILIPESVEAVGSVFPGLLTEMREAVVEKISENHEKALAMPYQNKLMLSMILGEDLVTGIDQFSIQSNQQSFAMSQMQAEQDKAQAGANKPSPGKAKAVTLSERSQTGTQAVINRKRS